MARYDAPSRRAGGQKQNTFFGGAAILAAGILVVKLIGMFYKIPLVNIIGDQGSTDFTNAYNIYSVLLTISTAGLPVAVSKLVSEANAQGRLNQVHKIFRLALMIFLTLGVLSFLVMYFRADWLAAAMNDTKAAPGIKAMAPAVVCVGCLSALRGYSQGHMNMTPTSVSQIIEALCKLVIGLSLAYALTKAGQPPEIAAAGAITGVTVGTMVALAYMILNFLVARSREHRLSRDVPESAATIIGDILRIAIPVTLGSSMVGIVTVVDAGLVQGQLQRVLLEKPECWALYAQYVDFAPLESAIAAWKESLSSGAASTMSALSAQVEAELKAGTAQSAALALHNTLESVSRTLYGNYSGALTIYNLPNALMAAITASVIPAVSGALTQWDKKGAARISSAALRVTALLACPMGVGLYVMGTPIMQLLYPSLEKEIAGPLLSMLGLANILVCLVLVSNSILQAYGFVTLPVLVMILGGGLKIAANYIVVAMPTVGIYGAPVGNLPCFGLCLLLDTLGVPETLISAVMLLIVTICVVVIVAVCIQYENFRRRYPVIADFYSQEEKDAFHQKFVWYVTGGVGAILFGVTLLMLFFSVFPEQEPYESYGASLFLLMVAGAVTSFVYAGINEEKYKIWKYNRNNNPTPAVKKRKGVINTICAALMAATTALLRADEEVLTAQARELAGRAVPREGGLAIDAAIVAAAPDPIASRTLRLLLGRLWGGDQNCSAAHLSALLRLCRGTARRTRPSGGCCICWGGRWNTGGSRGFPLLPAGTAGLSWRPETRQGRCWILDRCWP